MIEELKDYLKNTPKEQLLKEWEEVKGYSKDSPTAKELIKSFEKYKTMKEEVKEFEFNIVAYHPENKYSVEEMNDMFIEWIESKGMFCGGGINEIKDK